MQICRSGNHLTTYQFAFIIKPREEPERHPRAVINPTCISLRRHEGDSQPITNMRRRCTSTSQACWTRHAAMAINPWRSTGSEINRICLSHPKDDFEGECRKSSAFLPPLISTGCNVQASSKAFAFLEYGLKVRIVLVGICPPFDCCELRSA